MDKIQKSLKNQCLANPKRLLKIIVAGFIAPNNAMQMGLASIEGLNNIYSGSLMGEAILAIEQLEMIDIIELDSDMEILQRQ